MAIVVVTEAAMAINGDGEKVANVVAVPHKKNKIQVSSNKKPLNFYVNLAKRYMQQYNEIELSALGMAIGTVVTIAEILKNNGFASEKKILTSTVGTKDETNGRLIRKAKIEILMRKSDTFDNAMTAHKAERKKEGSKGAVVEVIKEENKVVEEIKD